MLPPKVYARYYVEDCQDCSDGEFDRAEEFPSWAECGECKNVTMCEDCIDEQGKRCSVCDADDEKWEDRAVCSACTRSCPECGDKFHRKCRKAHVKSCTRKSRAKRALAEAEELIKRKKVELQCVKGCLREAKRRKMAAEEELQALAAEEEEV